MLERGRVACLAGREDKAQRAAAAVCGKVDLGAQAAAGAPDLMVVGLACRGPFSLRAPDAFWWARTMVESTGTTQSRSPSASAWESRAVKTHSQVPSIAQFRSRV
ncbi:hypothetical protein [Streptomyces sp. NPDC057496]|uniref:hypothetical protein n=1 Tax=Streptomyces sp. NPDC057496 TaxID=3346149 RepID=UPI00368CC008